MTNTLQSKYPHLEIAVLKLSEVNKDNESKRIDSEYFKKEYLENEEIIKNLNVEYKEFRELIVTMTGGATPLGADYPEVGIPFLRVQNIMQNYFNLNDIVYITPQDDETLKRSRLNLGDVLFTITGAYGKAAVVEQNLVGANINQHSVKIKVKNINPYFLSTFLNSKFGKLQSDKRITGVTRPALDYQAIKKFLIPIFPIEFQKEIEVLVRDSHKALEQSKSLYKEAEVLLYESLGLDSENPLKSVLEYSKQSEESKNLNNNKCSTIAQHDNAKSQHNRGINYAILSLKQSFLKTGRLDSEYYQIKYELMEQQLKKNSFVTLQEICSLINYGSVPTSPYTDNGIGIPYIKGLNLKNLHISEDKLDRIVNTDDLDSKFFTKENDIIISQMGTVGDVGIVSKKQENYIFASFTIRIRLKNTKEFNPYYVALYIQHIAKEWYIQRNIAQASVRQNTDLPTIKNLYIPIVEQSMQEQIALYIQKSFKLRAEAKGLLESAKNKVEAAICGGGANLTHIRELLRKSRYYYRLACWIMIEELLLNSSYEAPFCHTKGAMATEESNTLKDVLTFAKSQHDKKGEAWHDNPAPCHFTSCHSTPTSYSKQSEESKNLNDNRYFTVAQHNKGINYAILSLKQSFLKTGRLDSEYYQVKYENNEKIIKRINYAKLDDLVYIKKSIEPGSLAYKQSGIPFIRVGNLSKFGIAQSEIFLDAKEIKDISALYPRKDEVLLSKDGSIGISYCMDSDKEVVLSGAILRLKLKENVKLLPHYLSLVLNSITTRLQAQRDSGGSIIEHWRIEEIQNILIPLLDSKTQANIESKIIQSFALRKQSKKLLEEAKHKLEEAICQT